MGNGTVHRTSKPVRMDTMYEVAVFGGGCFWCTEAVFKMLKGVILVMPGYTGGHKPNPTYEEVSTGKTGHAEVIYIEYDPTLITYRDLLTVFFASHDPSSLNRQGNDVGTQYRSVVFYTTPAQKKEVDQLIKELNNSSLDGRPLVTEAVPLEKFYPAESYHEDYYARHKDAPYCQLVINPKVEKIQKEFAALLNNKEKIINI